MSFIILPPRQTAVLWQMHESKSRAFDIEVPCYKPLLGFLSSNILTNLCGTSSEKDYVFSFYLHCIGLPVCFNSIAQDILQ